MAGQNWVDQGGYYTNGKLSKKVRSAAQPLMRFRQFCTIKEAFGTQKGHTVNFDKFGNVSSSGGTLVETNTMPETTVAVTQGTLTVTEYGNSIPFTGKVVKLSEIPVRPEIIKALKHDQKKVIDAAVEAQMDACQYRYVASDSDGAGTWTTNGTATATASTNLQKGHLENIVDQLMTLNVPTVDGDNYMGILTVKAARGLHDSLQAVWMYTKYPTNGEIGKYYQARCVRDTYAMDNTIGASNITGEAYFFGEDAVMEAVAVPEEIRVKVPTDYGRSLGVAWYAILGFKIIWGSGDTDHRIAKFDSA